MARTCQGVRGWDRDRERPGYPPRSDGGAREPIDPRVFRLLLAFEREKALRLRYCFSLLLLSFHREGVGQELLTRGTRRCAALAPNRLRGTDVVTLVTATTIGVLLVDAEPRVVGRIVERLSDLWPGETPLGRPARFGSSAGVAGFPWDSWSVDRLFRCAEERMTLAMASGGSVCVAAASGGTDVSAAARGESRSDASG
jgi:hypothetical protein